MSTVASESTFSLGGRILDPFHSSLSPQIVEALLCTKDCMFGDKVIKIQSSIYIFFIVLILVSYFDIVETTNISFEEIAQNIMSLNISIDDTFEDSIKLQDS